VTKVLISAAEIAARVDELARAIKEAGQEGDKPLLLVCILRGAFVFSADLMRALAREGLDAEIDFLGLSSYGDGQESLGRVQITQDIRTSMAGRDVLVVDDILDTGRTLDFVKALLTKRDAARVRTCVLLDKPQGRKSEISSDFCGFPCPPQFVVGYGMDLAGQRRGLPYIGTET